MTGIHLQWKDFSQQDWEKILQKIPRSNAFHDWDFAAEIAKEDKLSLERCLIKRGEKTIGLAQLSTKKYLGILKLRKLVRGPIFCEPAFPDEYGHILQKIKSRYPVYKGYVTQLMPELPDTEAVTKTMAGFGLNKVLEGYQSIWIDLGKSEDDLRADLHGKWRSQLSKAEKNNLLITTETTNERQDWLKKQSKAFRQAKGFQAYDPAVFFNLPASKILQLYAYEGETMDGPPLAAALFQIHGQTATYQLSYSSPSGRDLYAMNLLLWQALTRLKAKGIRYLDLGGIEPHKNQGLSHFKSRMGGEGFTLTGSYT